MNNMEPVTTRYLNVEGRADFLQRVSVRITAPDITGRILSEAERFAYAICEELDDMEARLQRLEGSSK